MKAFAEFCSVVGLLWKAARVGTLGDIALYQHLTCAIGERLSQYVSIAMIAMSFFVLFAPS
jgi:hypothetical protein